MGLNKKQVIYLVLIIIWMAVVFAFSNEPAEKSSKTSGGITEKVVQAITKDNKNITQSQRDIIETVIRKCAHFGLYAIGGFLTVNFVSTTKVQGKYIILYAIAFTFMYAITDEVHQLFVPGRSGEIRDVIIDTAGASAGTMIFWMLRKIVRRK